MKKVITDPLLMIATILIIVGFQVYWLKNTYDREKRLLESKTSVIFRSTLFDLQAKKLKLGLPGHADSVRSDIRLVFKKGNTGDVLVQHSEKEQIIGLGNAIRRNLEDSLKKEIKNGKKASMVISVNNSAFAYGNDTSLSAASKLGTNGPDKIFQVLYGIDSLQDSLRITDINTALYHSFQKEKINSSFAVSRKKRTASVKFENIQAGTRLEIQDEQPNEVTVGFSNPVTYVLQLKNEGAYLFKKILSPLLFSVFLVGVTMISFFVLYRNLNRQRRLTEIKNEFIGNITHELKTPISTVSVAIEAMKNFNALQSPERTQEYLDIANNELQRLGLLVDKVLKLSMFEKQQVELKQEWFDLKLLAEEVMSSMKIQFEKHHAAVSLTTAGTDFTIMADRLHILSVIYNLLDNALKYSKQNAVIEIKVEEKDEDLLLKVKDNGVGIPAAYKEKIFDKFFRVPSGDRHNVKGYGLGLSYVAHIIQQHHGTINVWSEEGKGTQFTIQLPKEYGKR